MKILKYVLLLLVCYIITGVGLLYSGVLHQWPVGYKTYIKYKKKQDTSSVNTDGPWVFYKNNTIQVKTLNMINGRLTAKTDTFRQKKQVKLTCHVAETGDVFIFRLKDSLQTEPDVYPAAARMLVLSDIEGNFKGFKQMLQYAGVINQSLKWSYGNGHLALVGDFFDRGLQVSECLWLIYKLEQEAEKAGGKVHFILGNHEIMNLKNDYRYVRKRYMANAQLVDIPYAEWYNANTELGRWLRTKNVIEKIGTVALAHGGISKPLVEQKLSLNQINQKARSYLDSAKAGHPAATDAVLGREGVFWYRGLALQQVSNQDVTAIMQYLGVGRLIIGHTIQPEIQSLYNGQVIPIDQPHQENSDRGLMKALLISEGRPYAISTQGELRLIK